ncbi:MAG: hypothetical protein JOZ69_04960 [Myxococcales bacterium]|nr:hypothetical protein [Myxococcales bacterium]
MSQQHPKPPAQNNAAPAAPKPNPAQGGASNDPELQNEGEGSRSGARRYDAGAERAASDPKRVEKLATDAEKALEGDEGSSLRQAEERGKKGAHH